jgi:hypothetical protein
MRAIIAAVFLFTVAGVACAAPHKATVSAEQSKAAVTAYHELKPNELETKKVETLPAGVQVVERIDVSDKIRSASFGHTTTLLVVAGGKEFYVEYGKSTNKPAALFGPFPVATK